MPSQDSNLAEKDPIINETKTDIRIQETDTKTQIEGKKDKQDIYMTKMYMILYVYSLPFDPPGHMLKMCP